MTKTRGNLVAATLTSTNNITVHCMFNPEHYTLTKKNTYNSGDALVKPPKPEFERFDRSTLKLSTLYFDTYGTNDDLTQITNKLWSLMLPENGNAEKPKPPEVTFAWGTFSFTAVITDMSMKFTLFDKDGKPVRSEVEITFMQSEDPTRIPHQNPSSGGGPIQEVRKVITGDRLDLIAADVYGDATQWRHIADYNEINNPRQLRPGQIITIPPLH